MLTSEGEYVRLLSDVTLCALELHLETLQSQLELEQIGRGLAIHSSSGNHLVSNTPTYAGHTMRLRHPEGSTVTLRIGMLPEHALLAHHHLACR